MYWYNEVTGEAAWEDPRLNTWRPVLDKETGHTRSVDDCHGVRDLPWPKRSRTSARDSRAVAMPVSQGRLSTIIRKRSNPSGSRLRKWLGRRLPTEAERRGEIESP